MTGEIGKVDLSLPYCLLMCSVWAAGLISHHASPCLVKRAVSLTSGVRVPFFEADL